MTKGQKFNKDVAKIVESFNPKPSTRLYTWEINTSLGKLDITVHDPEPRQKLFSVFMRFDNPAAAKAATDCNPFTGKWNIHLTDPESALEELKTRLNKYKDSPMDEKDLLKNITEAFESLSGDEIAEIHNNICKTKVEYQGDSQWKAIL